jgi:hypothetical protein
MSLYEDLPPPFASGAADAGAPGGPQPQPGASPAAAVSASADAFARHTLSAPATVAPAAAANATTGAAARPVPMASGACQCTAACREGQRDGALTDRRVLRSHRVVAAGARDAGAGAKKACHSAARRAGRPPRQCAPLGPILLLPDNSNNSVPRRSCRDWVPPPSVMGSSPNTHTQTHTRTSLTTTLGHAAGRRTRRHRNGRHRHRHRCHGRGRGRGDACLCGRVRSSQAKRVRDHQGAVGRRAAGRPQAHPARSVRWVPHTQTHIHTHAHIHTHTHMPTPTIRTPTHTHTLIHTHTLSHTHIPSLSLSHSLTHTLTHIHTCIRVFVRIEMDWRRRTPEPDVGSGDDAHTPRTRRRDVPAAPAPPASSSTAASMAAMTATTGEEAYLARARHTAPAPVPVAAVAAPTETLSRGERMMARMGWRAGQGLGREADPSASAHPMDASIPGRSNSGKAAPSRVVLLRVRVHVHVHVRAEAPAPQH